MNQTVGVINLNNDDNAEMTFWVTERIGCKL